jgi:hypothetical protein
VNLRSFLRIEPSIAQKALILISFLGLLSILANWFCLHTIDRVEDTNSGIIEHIAPARLALSEAKGALTAFGLGVYKMTSYTDRAEIAEEANAMVGEFNAIGNALGNVASSQEVKSLAAQTTQALTDINRQTQSVQQATQAVVEAISAISNVIGSIDDISVAITEAVGQQTVASRNIAQNVDDAAMHTRQVSSIISAANEFAVQTGELAGRILQAAQELSQQAEVLQTDAGGFIGQVKAA